MLCGTVFICHELHWLSWYNFLFVESCWVYVSYHRWFSGGVILLNNRSNVMTTLCLILMI